MDREELDLIVLEDDGGNQIEMEIIDYMYYEGKEYALLTEYKEDHDEEEPLEVLVMEVRPLDDDEENEEFVPISDDLGEKLVELFQKDWEEMEDEEEE